MEPYLTSYGPSGLPVNNNRLSSASLNKDQVNQNRFGNLNIYEKIPDPATAKHTPLNSPANPPTFSSNPSTEIDPSPSYLTCLPTANSYTFVVPQQQRQQFLQRPKVSSEELSHILSTHTASTLAIRVNQPQVYQTGPSNSEAGLSSSALSLANMSTLAIHYDARFDAGIRPNSYSWPIFNMPEQYGNQIIGSSNAYDVAVSNPEAIYTPSLTSLSPSPPPCMFSPEQRELKRQKDQARKVSKHRLRRERSTSNPYDMSQSTTPDMIPRSVNNPFDTSMSSTSLPTETLMPLPSQPYMMDSPIPLSMANSPVPMSNCDSPELYGSPFPMLSDDFGTSYPLMPFSSATEPGLPSYVTPRPHSLSAGAQDQAYYYRSSPTLAQESQDTIRVVHSRPKPQCWDHGCNGRQFSTFSNLLRHQREKSGVASKPTCPKCGAEFTRTTARNGHMAHEKCKQRSNS